MTKKSWIILFVIFCLGLVLRTYQLAKIPGILNRDETALAYNAWSLQQTGLDEWGQKWPLFFQSFGDYKLPGYIWSLVFLFSFLPVNDLVVKIPSLVAGQLLILVVFAWAKKLKISTFSSLLVALMVAINPIFWFYSRIAFEANLSLFLFTSGLYFLFFGQDKKQYLYQLLALVLILLAVLTYNTPLLLLPFITLLLVILKGVKKSLIVSFSLLILFLLIMKEMLPLTSQKQAITIFSDETVWRQSIDYRQQFTGIWQKILGNNYFYYLTLMGKNLINSFSFKYLVTSGGSHPWHSLPHWGHLFPVTYLLGFLGILKQLTLTFDQLTNKKDWRKVTEKLLLLFLLLVSLIPAVITVDAPHATRSLLFFVIWVLLAGVGFDYLLKVIQKRLPKLQSLFKILMVGLLFYSLFFYAQGYFWAYAHQYPDSLNTALIEKLQQAESKYPDQTIAIVDSGGYDYILLAWYLKIPPSQFLSDNVKQLPNSYGFRYGERVGRFHFIAEPKDLGPDEKVMINGYGDNWQIIER